MSTATAEVGDLRARGQPLGKAVGHRKDHVDERCVEHLPALFGHQRVEARVLAVGEPAAGAEAADHLLLDLRQQWDELSDAREVVRARGTGEHRGTLPRQRVRLRRCVVFDDPRRHDPTEPLPHVPLVESGGIGDLSTARRRELGQRVPQGGLVSDGQQDGQARAVDRPDDPLGELFGGVGVHALSMVVIVVVPGRSVVPAMLSIPQRAMTQFGSNRFIKLLAVV